MIEEEFKQTGKLLFIIIVLLFTGWIGYRAGFNGVERINCQSDADSIAIYLEYQMQDLNNTLQRIPYNKLIAPEVSKLVYYYFTYPMISRDLLVDMINEGLMNVTREKLEWNDLDASVNYPERFSLDES